MKVMRQDTNKIKIRNILFKTIDFERMVHVLENLYFDNNQFIFEENHKYTILKLIEKLNYIIENVKPIEKKIYNNKFSWKIIDRIIFENRYENLIIPLKDFSFNNYETGIDTVYINQQLEIIGKLYQSGKIQLENLTFLDNGIIKSLPNKIKDYIFELALELSEKMPTGLTLGEFESVWLYIDGIINRRFDLADLKHVGRLYWKITKFFTNFYKSFDVICQ